MPAITLLSEADLRSCITLDRDAIDAIAVSYTHLTLPTSDLV